jgi:uncharacterized protein (DUF305 family)
MNRNVKIVGTLAIAGLALTGCSLSIGDHDDAKPLPGMSNMMSNTTEAGLNHADVMFLQGMIPHHQQAIDMSKVVPAHSKNADVIALAAKIQAAQQPEIDEMNKWLTDAGQSGSMGGMDMGDMGGMGMMSDSEMTDLEAANGSAFDKLFLTGMIAHHEGAVHMAKAIIANGQDSRVRELATNILTGQTAEIEQMKAMLTALK